LLKTGLQGEVYRWKLNQHWPEQNVTQNVFEGRPVSSAKVPWIKLTTLPGGTGRILRG
jgi:hypothetical protein